MTKEQHTYFLNILLALSASLLCIISIELFCYHYLNIPSHMPSLVYFDPSQEPPKRLKPNTNVVAHGAYREFSYRITTNSYGFRRTYPFKNNAEIYSVVILGDSQTFGVGTNDEKTLASLLAKRLDASVLNTACPGYNTIEEYWTYKNRVQGFKPQHVLLLFFAGNDPYENYKNRERYDVSLRSRTTLEKPKPMHWLTVSNLKDFLSKRSAIYSSLINLRQVPQINRLLYKYNLVNPVPPAELAIFKKNVTKQADAHWQITEQVIRDLHEMVASDGPEFWIVFIPDRYQVDSVHWQRWVVKYNLRVADYDLKLPNRRLAEFARKNGIHFIDLTEKLTSSQSQGRNVYWKIDSHLNPLGHELIADSLAFNLHQYVQPTRKENK